MKIQLDDPIPVLSLNFLGLGIDIAYSKNQQFLTVQLNFVVGHVLMYWNVT